jgi:hypothetical protein
MKAHLTERYVKGLQPKAKNIIVYDEEVVGFGVRITSSGTRAFILTYRIEARERRLTIGAWPDWSVTAAREEAKRLKREVDQGRDPMAERDEARESPNVRQLIDRYLEEHAAKLAKRNRDDQASTLRKLVEPAWGPRKAAEIQHDDVDQLLRRIAGGTPGKRGRKPTPVRANRLGEILRKMFNLAIRWRIRADNPAAGFARNAEAPRDRYLSTEEIGRLSAALDAHPNRRAADAVRLILLTSARRGQQHRPCSAQCLLQGERSVIDAFASAIDALFADSNIGEGALWKAGGVGAGVAVRIIRKSPDRMAEFGDSRAVLPTVGIDIRCSQAPTIAEGDLIVIGAETFKIISEPMRDALGLALSIEGAIL